MQLINEKLDYTKGWSRPDVYLFTGNRIVTKDGRLVMGRGAAKELRDNYPGIDEMLGKKIKGLPPHSKLALLHMGGEQVLMWFQVKHHWGDAASPALIGLATSQLKAIAEMPENQDIRFHMNAPGIGNGRLRWEDVEPLLRPLPDNVLIYKI